MSEADGDRYEPHTCTCGRRIYAGMAVAVGRFRPGGPIGYRAESMPDAPLRATRAEAVQDQHDWLEGVHRGAA